MEEYGLLWYRYSPVTATTAAATLNDFPNARLLQFYPGSQRYPPGLERFYPIVVILWFNCNLPTIPDLIRLSRSIHKAGVLSEWLPAPNRV